MDLSLVKLLLAANLGSEVIVSHGLGRKRDEMNPIRANANMTIYGKGDYSFAIKGAGKASESEIVLTSSMKVPRFSRGTLFSISMGKALFQPPIATIHKKMAM